MTSRNRQQPDGEFLGNGRGRWTMLDRALEGASAEEKARVRGVLLRYGIDEDNEFFMIFVAIGHLLILVEEAPENWRALFDDVHLELKQWSQENFKSLESIQKHTQTSAELIVVLRQLLDSMKRSDSRSDSLLSTLNTLSRKLNSIEKLDGIETTLTAMQTSNRQSAGKLNQLDQQLETLTGFANQRDWILISSAAFAIVTLVVLMVSNWTTARRFNTQELLIRRQSERIAWLLEKANREECLTGVKPLSDPQCRQYQ